MGERFTSPDDVGETKALKEMDTEVARALRPQRLYSRYNTAYRMICAGAGLQSGAK